MQIGLEYFFETEGLEYGVSHLPNQRTENEECK